VATGHQFNLQSEGDNDWLEWQPSLVVGEPLPQHFYPLPVPVRSELQWTYKGWMGAKHRSRSAWLLVSEHGLLGVEDILTKPEEANALQPNLSIKGETFALNVEPSHQANGLALLPLAPAGKPWPQTRLRSPEVPEDLLLIADTNAPPLLISSNRVEVSTGRWLLDSSIQRDSDWHGAVAVAVEDGAVIGFLDCLDGAQAVIPLDPLLLNPK
jgi:hypothetical protein